jgi:hypothetical protein
MTESGIFRIVVKLAPENRAAYLAQTCGSDAVLRGDVESLLREQNCSAVMPSESPLTGSAGREQQGHLPDRTTE